MATATVSRSLPLSTHSALGTMHQKATYTFDQPVLKKGLGGGALNTNTRKHRRHHNRNNSEDDPSDGNGSLTYSAASSINSAGESTDSSFADIMKVLDMQDPNGMGHGTKDKGMSPAEYHMHLHQRQQAHDLKHRSSQASVASSLQYSAASLQYSTDGESNMLHGADIVSAITGGQPSDSLGYDGGSYGNGTAEAFDNQNIMFAPAEATDSLKKRKKDKRNRKKDGTSPKNSVNGKGTDPSLSSTSTAASPSNNASPKATSSPNRTPPPKPANPEFLFVDGEDLCYSEWWMSCFPDALFKDMIPER